MPVTWLTPAPEQTSGATPAVREFHILLTPHLSMGPQGFVWMIGLSAGMLALPLIALLGTPVLWGLLPFVGLVLWALWYALARNSAERQALCEELRLTRDRIEITRTNPHRAAQHWAANPYWVRLSLAEQSGPVENYLTLTGGGGRDVELGAFLSPEERAALHTALGLALRQMR